MCKKCDGEQMIDILGNNGEIIKTVECDCANEEYAKCCGTTSEHCRCDDDYEQTITGDELDND